MGEYAKFLYVRVVNPGAIDEYVIVGEDPHDVSDAVVGDNDTLEETVGRYALVGTGKIQYVAPAYVENTAS